MPDPLERRAILRRLAGVPTAIRPPGAGDEAAFDQACTRCGDCLDACPEAILIPGPGAMPAIDFSFGACTFCGACARACKAGAIDLVAGWSCVAVIGTGCLEPKGVTCRVCELACDAAAIRFRPAIGGRAIPRIDPGACTGCGACVATCPASAIDVPFGQPADDLPIEREAAG